MAATTRNQHWQIFAACQMHVHDASLLGTFSKPRTPQSSMMGKTFEGEVMIAAELKSGMRNIESVVISNVRERGGNINGDSFVWNHGAANDRPPEIVSARITVNARTACLILPREYYEDSASTVTRIEVRDAINDCVEFLAA